jgi:hypothetical protein
MNNKNLNNISQQRKLHFKQWSNKGFAVFCSLGKVVHISCLSVSVTQWIGVIVEHIEEIINLCIANETDEVAEEIKEQELIQFIPVMVNSQVECGKSVLIKNKNINSR